MLAREFAFAQLFNSGIYLALGPATVLHKLKSFQRGGCYFESLTHHWQRTVR